MKPLRVILTGGGTGGHVYPALAIGAAIRSASPGVELLYLGTARGLEADVVPRAGVPFQQVRAAGVLGRTPLQAAAALGRTALGCLDARAAIVRFRPDLVVATGGYVAAPVAVAAWLSRVPVAIQEQNAVPGLTNRLLSRIARLVFLPFPEAAAHFPACLSRAVRPGGPRLQVTGNPIRPEVLAADRGSARAELGIPAHAEVLYVTAGSGGAARLHEATCDALPALLRRPSLTVLYSTGRRYHPRVLEMLAERGLRPDAEGGRLRVVPFFYRAELPLAAADLAVARAGAMTVSELAARGLPAILVPSPNVANNHQVANAAVLGAAGAARVVSDAELSGERLAREVAGLLDRPGELRRMAEAARGVARPDALDRIVAALLGLASRS